MPAENNKLLWISVAVCVFVLGLAITGLFLFAPRSGSGTRPATAGDLAAPRVTDPQDFLNVPPPTPTVEQPRGEGDIIVIYGDKPATLSPLPGEAAIPAAPVAVAPHTPTSLAPPAPKAAPAAKPAVAAKPAATSPAVKTPVPAKVVPKTVTVNEFWIQVGSFTSRGRADELRQSLGEKGIAALIAVKDIDSKSWYRVRLGPYGTKKEADGWLSRVKLVPGCAESLVIQNKVTKTAG